MARIECEDCKLVYYRWPYSRWTPGFSADGRDRTEYEEKQRLGFALLVSLSMILPALLMSRLATSGKPAPMKSHSEFMPTNEIEQPQTHLTSAKRQLAESIDSAEIDVSIVENFDSTTNVVDENKPDS